MKSSSQEPEKNSLIQNNNEDREEQERSVERLRSEKQKRERRPKTPGEG